LGSGAGKESSPFGIPQCGIVSVPARDGPETPVPWVVVGGQAPLPGTFGNAGSRRKVGLPGVNWERAERNSHATHRRARSGLLCHSILHDWFE
jgi:hypothetical protein